MTDIILAIDPGRTGGFAVWTTEGISLHAMPENEYRTRALIDRLTPQGVNIRAIIEHVGSLGPNDPLKGQRLFNFGRGYGFLRGVLDLVLLQNAPDTQFVQLTRKHCPKPGNVRT